MVAADAVPSGLAPAVGAVLGHPRYLTAAQELAAAATAVGNGELATDLVEALAGAVASRR